METNRLEEYQAVLDLAMQSICEQGGAKFVGIQKQLTPAVPPLVMFQGPNRSTLCLPLFTITPEAVAARIKESNTAFAVA